MTDPIQSAAMTDLINLATAHGAFLSEYVSSGTLITFEPAELEAFAAALAARPVTPASAPEALTPEQANVQMRLVELCNFWSSNTLSPDEYRAAASFWRDRIAALAAPSTPAAIGDSAAFGFGTVVGPVVAPSTPAAEDVGLGDLIFALDRWKATPSRDSTPALNALYEVISHLAATQGAPSTPAAPRDREADRARFPDAAFNRWLDEPITENCEFTVWNQVWDVCDAWHGWQNRAFYEPAATQAQASDKGAA